MDRLLIVAVLLIATFAQNVFAEEVLKTPPKAEQTAPGPSPDAVAAKNKMFSQRGRLAQINAWLSQGVLGENSEGLLVVRGKSKTSVERALKDENEDREKMFKELSQKNGTTVMEQRKLYAKKRRKDVPKGSPVQETDGSWGLKA